ncbi:MAG: polysaccharide deacetylase family protein [Verrucomicrobia bacterium]|nr:polysaccharide deacetylase family protein [Verrucomicrobiota bacterium]
MSKSQAEMHGLGTHQAENVGNTYIVPRKSFVIRHLQTMKSLVVSLHDVSPLTQTSCEEILMQLRQLGIDQTSLLVIPNHHRQAPVRENSSFQNWLVRKVEAGHEPVLHGYFHQRDKRNSESFWARLTTEIYTAGEGEFFDLLTEEACMRVERGLEDLAFLRRKIVGFIAPAWLLGANAEIAIRKLGFSYTTRLRTVRIFARGADFRSQSLVWSTRAPWRAMISLAWNRSLAAGLSGAPLVRIGIHPPDLQHPATWQQVRRLAAETRRCRECVSYEKFVEHLSLPQG